MTRSLAPRRSTWFSAPLHSRRRPSAVDPEPKGAGFYYIDHLTHNVVRGNMDTWYKFYATAFNFREIRFFDIKGKVTGLTSRALTSPCGKIRIPINESADEDSQIEEYLKEYKGEGIQHIAVGAHDIYAATDAIAARGLEFMPGPPDTYYAQSTARVKDHAEPIERMKRHGILIDGEGVVEVACSLRQLGIVACKRSLVFLVVCT